MTDSITIRFPDGSREFRYVDRAVAKDDVIWHSGEPYRVVSISTEGVAIVERVGGGGGTDRPKRDATENSSELVDEIRAARNEAVLRDLNERLEAHNKWLEERVSEWLCECANVDCTTLIELSIQEYESVRATPTRFVIAANEQHVDSEIEQVVQREQRYWVVEKIGIGAEVAEQRDPRSPEP